LDRLLHHSTTINIRGESYRLKERKKSWPPPGGAGHGAERIRTITPQRAHGEEVIPSI
jgi:hypothetical protein